MATTSTSHDNNNLRYDQTSVNGIESKQNSFAITLPSAAQVINPKTISNA